MDCLGFLLRGVKVRRTVMRGGGGGAGGVPNLFQVFEFGSSPK